MSRAVAACLFSVAMLCCAASNAAALPADSQWSRATDGQIPPGAFALGREATGQAQYGCRAVHNNGLHLGRVVAGSRGCAIGYAGHELIRANYEVLTARATLPPQVIAGARVRQGALADKPTITLQPSRGTGPAPTIDSGGSVRRGFDQNGHPYVEQRKTDGTIVRRLPNGTQVTHPDGKQEFIPLQFAAANTQMPTPPELPPDPQRGRLWLDRHNDALLAVISLLVRHDDSEMKKFSAAEQSEAGTDVFEQISYRTKIANFLAAG